MNVGIREQLAEAWDRLAQGLGEESQAALQEQSFSRYLVNSRRFK